MNTEPIDPPNGCQTIPGYIIEVARGGPWMTKAGSWTLKWGERGVWDAQEAAEAAVQAWIDLHEQKHEAF